MEALTYARQSDTNNDKRVSKDDKETLSTRAQLTACLELAAKNGDRIAREFSEQFTGTTDNRPQLEALRAFVQENARTYRDPEHPKRIKRLYIYKYARLSRSEEDTRALWSWFRTHGIEIVPVADAKYEDTLEGRLMLTLVATFAEMQVRDGREHASRARESLVSAGKLVCSGKPLYGYLYDMATRTRILDSETAPIVQRIFGEIAAGRTQKAVAAGLTLDNVPSPRMYWAARKSAENRPSRLKSPKVWSERTIQRIIRDPSYHGEAMTLNRYAPTDGYYANGHRRIEQRAGRKVGAGTPAIVSEKLWTDANKMMGQRSKPAVRHKHWLTGRVTCGNCGKSMVRCVKKNRSCGSAWVCTAYTHGRKCLNGFIPNTEVEPQAWAKLLKWLKNPEVIEEKLAELHAKMVDQSWEKQAHQNEAQISKLKKALGRLVSQYAAEDDETLLQVVDAQIAQLRAEIDACKRLAESLAGRVAEAQTARQYIDDLKTQIRARIVGGEATDEEKAALADAIGLRIITTRTDDAKRLVVFRAFDYASGLRLLSQGNLDAIIDQNVPESVLPSYQTTDKSPAAPES